MCVLISVLDINRQVVKIKCGILVSVFQSWLIIDCIGVEFRQVEDLSFVGTCKNIYIKI